ncbi:hypothetical protein [Streptomyces sp. HSG2]|uniref:hypothetical protein n=1 Tax=Streptomyces sp. HSG2 TaxID=2797167 RepID=UPI0019035E9C|nr:hypothetical protein [Streptomyces sp. HSG2]
MLGSRTALVHEALTGPLDETHPGFVDDKPAPVATVTPSSLVTAGALSVVGVGVCVAGGFTLAAALG